MIHNIKNNIDIRNTITDSNLRTLACSQFFTRKAVRYTGRNEEWIDLSSHNSLMNNSTIADFNTDVTINVQNQSKVMVNCHIGVSDERGNGFIHLRLGKKVDGEIVWGTSSGITTTRDDELTDPKGDNTLGPNPSSNRLESWDYIFTDRTQSIYTMNPSFVDSNPTNSLTGNHDITYFIRIRIETKNGSTHSLDIGQSHSISSPNRVCVPTILAAYELPVKNILL